MSKRQLLDIEFSALRCDLVRPLLEGRASVEGVRLKAVKPISMIDKDDPQMKSGELGLRELDLSCFLSAFEAGWEIIGLPVFCERRPLFGLIFCHADSGIGSPVDLAGKRIGSHTYRTALTVWARGLLTQRYGVGFANVKWVLQTREFFPVHDRLLDVEYVDDTRNMMQRLIAREVDAMITEIADAKLFETLENHPKVRRLFRDYPGEDRILYKETGIVPPVRVMVMSRKLDREHPDLAARFYQAFEQAKKIAYDDILSDRSGLPVVYLREKLTDQLATWGDPWNYGIEANRNTLNAFLRYNFEQGMIRAQPSCADIFAASTRDT